MKKAFQHVFLNGFALFIASQIFSGLILKGGFMTLVIGGILLALGFKILKPILGIITLPFNILTLGLFSIFTIAFILFLVTLVYSQIQVRAFYFQGVNFGGVEIHPFSVSLLLSYIIISGTIYLITKTLLSLFGK